jgi:hypothetical protein
MRCSEGEPIPKNLLEINKFSVSISDEVLEDLRKRLESAHFVEPIEGTANLIMDLMVIT